MAQELKRPSAPHRISELAFHEWFRGTRDGDPIVAMKVGAYPNVTLVIVPKDGPVTSYYYGAAGDPKGVQFLDYLLEDEFVSIYGSAKERSDEADLGPEPKAGLILPTLMVGDTNYRQVPSFTTFYTKRRDSTLGPGTGRLTMIVHDHPWAANKERDGRRAEGIVITDGGYDYEIYDRDDCYFERTYVFNGYALHEQEMFRRQKPIREHRETLSQMPGWPKGW